MNVFVSYRVSILIESEICFVLIEFVRRLDPRFAAHGDSMINVFAAILGATTSALPMPLPADKSLDCAVRALAHSYACALHNTRWVALFARISCQAQRGVSAFLAVITRTAPASHSID